jgi:hypothetical protein
MKGVPEEWLKVLGPGVTFADADQYFCAARRAPTHPLEPLQFKPVHKEPWLMRAWKVDIDERWDEPDFRVSVTVDRKGGVTFGQWQMIDEHDDHEMTRR